MRKKQSHQLIASIVMIVLLLIGIGYAALSTNLSITGNTAVSGNNWDIHFANVKVATGSVTANTPAAIDNNDNTKVNFAATLNKPGDFYEFTVDIVNAGTIDGMVNSISSLVNNQAISNLPSYLIYSLSYLDGDEILTNHYFPTGETETIKVRVEFKEDITVQELPSSTTTTNFSISINYIQANSNAIHRFVYTGESNYIYTGSAMPNNITTYNTYQETRANFANNPFFLKHKISNNTVSYTLLGYILNNNVHYVDSGLNEDNLEEYADKLESVFGASNCSNNSNGFYCYNSTENVGVALDTHNNQVYAYNTNTGYGDYVCEIYLTNPVYSDCFLQ